MGYWAQPFFFSPIIRTFRKATAALFGLSGRSETAKEMSLFTEDHGNTNSVFWGLSPLELACGKCAQPTQRKGKSNECQDWETKYDPGPGKWVPKDDSAVSLVATPRLEGRGRHICEFEASLTDIVFLGQPGISPCVKKIKNKNYLVEIKAWIFQKNHTWTQEGSETHLENVDRQAVNVLVLETMGKGSCLYLHPHKNPSLRAEPTTVDIKFPVKNNQNFSEQNWRGEKAESGEFYL